jgi:hypothetical protein
MLKFPGGLLTRNLGGDCGFVKRSNIDLKGSACGSSSGVPGVNGARDRCFDRYLSRKASGALTCFWGGPSHIDVVAGPCSPTLRIADLACSR